ncbi:GntR family transcriptional regulator [Corynebacterium sp. AOP40-9SA-29]|uniref:GntR family transcriptional regulator n=1 Tax=Corynebacterium sp. AOP40-9SA-29 TaxID=3457677 RepID=UPI0040337506
MDATPLAEQLSTRIVEDLRRSGAVEGTRLVERTLAGQLGVSRTPVRAALSLLVEAGTVRRDGRGYVLAQLPPAGQDAGPEESAYLAIAGDRLDGELGEQVTENALMRRYGLGAGQLQQVLRRIASEGWAEPAPGYGWRFREVLTSSDAYQQSHRFRRIVEPAALLEPGYLVDVADLTARRAEQVALADGRAAQVSVPELFDLNSRFHEVLVAGSHNPFLVDSVARVNRLRRLQEYRRTLRPARAQVRCAEHVAIADLVLEGRLAEASDLLGEHLGGVAEEKGK